jgi:hypothetical protein
MYTKEDYDAMPDFAVPAVLRSNCESLYLGLVRAVSSSQRCAALVQSRPHVAAVFVLPFSDEA